MSLSISIEVCVDSVASAVASEKGGAHRVELCSNLAEGGVTPSAGMIAMVRKRVGIAVHVLIRARAGDFCYTSDEFEVMRRDIVLAKQLGANGVVFGILDGERHVDVERTRELIGLAQPLNVTFHRAFDAASDLPAALEDVVRAGAERVLTSGGAPTAEDGAGMITRLVAAASGRIAVMACGTIRAANVASIVERTGVREVHASLQSPVPTRLLAGEERTPSGSAPGGDRRAEVLPETVAAFLGAAAKAAATSHPHP